MALQCSRIMWSFLTTVPDVLLVQKMVPNGVIMVKTKAKVSVYSLSSQYTELSLFPSPNNRPDTLLNYLTFQGEYTHIYTP